MAFRTRRQTRYEALKGAGLLPFEAGELSRLTVAEIRSTPYIRDFIKMRQGWLEDAPSVAYYIDKVRGYYIDKGWTITRAGREIVGGTMVWNWIRELEEQYEKDHPDYETPPGIAGKKKRKKFVQWRR